MNKMPKIIIGLALAGVTCVALPVGVSSIMNKEPKVNLQELQVNINNQMKEKLTEQKTELDKYYKGEIDKLKSNMSAEEKAKMEEAEKNKRVTEKLFDIVLKYYKSNSNAKSVLCKTSDGNDNVYGLEFNSKKNTAYMIRDNKDKVGNAYTIKQTNSKSTEDGVLVEKNDAVLTIQTEQKDKFDINKCDLAIEYLNTLLGTELSDKDKSALNIQANLNLKDLSSVSDLNAYIYNGESMKIGDFVFKCKKSKAEDSDLTIIEYTITSHKTTPIKEDKDKDKKAENTTDVNKENK